MRKGIILCLVLSLLVTMIFAPVDAIETEPREVTLDVFSNLLGVTSADGLYRDNTFYVHPQLICDLTGAKYQVMQEGSQVMFLFNHCMREIYVDVSGTAAEHLGEDRYEFRLPVICHNGELYTSMVHLLRYVGCTVQFAENEKSNIHVSIYCPYTVLDLMADFTACESRYFSWSEAEGFLAENDLYVLLAALDTLLVNYDNDLYKYLVALLPGDLDDPSKDVYEDAIYKILCNEGHSYLSDENVQMRIIHSQMDTISLGVDLNNFLSDVVINSIDVGDSVKNVLSGTFTFDRMLFSTIDDWLNAVEKTYQYIRLSENLHVLLEDTLCQYKRGDALYEQDPQLFKAGQAIQEVTGNTDGRWEEVRRETVDSFLNNTANEIVDTVLDAKSPIFGIIDQVYDAVTYLVKYAPDTEEYVEGERRVTMAMVDQRIQQVARIRIEECARQWEKNLMYLGSSDTTHQRQMRSAMILALKASLTARENLIASNFVTEESAAQMAQKAKETAILLYQAENAVLVPLGIPPQAEEDISWIRLLAKPEVIVTVQFTERQVDDYYHETVAYPTVHISGNEDVAQRINQTIIKEIVAPFINPIPSIDPEFPYHFDVVLTLEAAYASDRVLSIGSQDDDQSFVWRNGSLEPNRRFIYTTYRVFDLRTGETLHISDLLDPTNPFAKQELAEQFKKVMTDIQNSREWSENLYIDRTAQEFVDGAWFGSWYLSESGLSFTFDQGQIGSNAYGSIDGTILYADLEGILAKAFLPTKHSGNGNCEVSDADGTEKERIYGTQTSKALIVAGKCCDVTVRSKDLGSILFYANRISDALAWVPEAEQYTTQHR